MCARWRYHLYRIGTFKPNGNVVGWVHWTWHIQYPVAAFFAIEERDTEFDAYISLKVTGPAYVKGSRKKNTLTVDRILFTPRGAKVDMPVLTHTAPRRRRQVEIRPPDPRPLSAVRRISF